MSRIFSARFCFTLLTAGGAAALLYIQVNLLAASMFPGESKAPLMITLLVTTAASAIISILVSSTEEHGTDSDAEDARGIATFVFINAAASAVGLLSNLLESLEFQCPAGPNGLTWILEVFLREDQAPLFPYVLALSIALMFVVWMLFEGAGLLNSQEQWTDQKISFVYSFSFVLFLFWIAIGTKWKSVPFGEEAIANFWTAAFYSLVALVSAWIYGRALFNGIKAAPKFVSTLGRGFLQILSNWRLWAILASGTLTVLLGFWLTSFVVPWLNQLLYSLLNLLGMLGDATAREMSQVVPAVGGVARGELLLLGPILFGCLLVALLTIIIIQLFTRAISILSEFRGFTWRDVKQIFIGGSLFMVALVVAPIFGLPWLLYIVFRQKIFWRVASVAVLISLLSADSIVSYLKPTPVYEHRIVATPPMDDPMPVWSAVHVPQSPIHATVSKVQFCSDRIGTFGWRYGSTDTIEQQIDACYDDIERSQGKTLRVLVAASTAGSSRSAEESRSFARAEELSIWAARSFEDTSSTYVLDLGVSRFSDLADALRPLVGPTNSRRPIGGFMVESSDDRATHDQLLQLTISLISRARLDTSFSKCDLYQVRASGDRKLQATNLNLCEAG